jgi:hypothetical protein
MEVMVVFDNMMDRFGTEDEKRIEGEWKPDSRPLTSEGENYGNNVYSD